MAIDGNPLKHSWAGKLHEADAWAHQRQALLESECITNSQEVMRMTLLLR